MNEYIGAIGLELRSNVTAAGELQVILAREPVASPARDEVVLRVEATPLNPTDIWSLFGTADLGSVRIDDLDGGRRLVADVPQSAMGAMRTRIDRAVSVGGEGAGVIVDAGEDVRHLLGRTVATMAGGMYAQFRTLAASDCLVMPEGILPRQAGSALVNPLTALGMVETMRDEGHKALVLTAAASTLGQMLNRICLADGIGLVSIVRAADQAQLLRQQGAKLICDSSAPTFENDLADAIAAAGATIAFDATGGGRLAGQILNAMESAILRTAIDVGPYGSAVQKQIYIYGNLDPRPTELDRAWGSAWGMGGWLRTAFLERIGPEANSRLRERIVAELTTTFACSYADEISLPDVLNPDVIAQYRARGTGGKYLVNPSKH